MSAPDDTTIGQPVNYQYQCPHCDVITVIPASKPFEYEDDYCTSCGEHRYSFPVDDENDMPAPEQSGRLDHGA